MSTNVTFVSVIVPVYNMEHYVAATIESALRSGYPAFEVISIDDGSTDGSQAVIQKFAQQDERVVFLQQANAGASVARNTAIQHAKGAYILPLDADNLICPNYIAKAAALLDQHPDVKVVSAEAEFFGDKTGTWKLPEFSLQLLARRNLIDNCAMYRKADWEKAGGYCPELLGREDWDFWISMLKSGGRFIRIPEIGFQYRVTGNSKRKRTRHLKKEIIDTLNKRHAVFFEEQLGGPLRYSRTWSKLINTIDKKIKQGKNNLKR